MKKNTILIALFFSFCSFGQVGTVFSAGGLNYKIMGAKTVEVSTNIGIGGAVSLPSNLNYNNANYLVTGVGEEAFNGCTGLTSVTIPNSVTSIGFSAFEGCMGLTSVAIPNSVTSIGFNTFYGCSSLQTIPSFNLSKVTNATLMFYSCNKLESASLSTTNKITNLKSLKDKIN